MAWRDAKDIAEKQAWEEAHARRENIFRQEEAEGDSSSLCPAGVCTPDRRNVITGTSGLREPNGTIIAQPVQTHDHFNYGRIAHIGKREKV